MWVSLVVIDVLFNVELIVVAVGWQVWISWVGGGMLFGSVLGVAGVG